MAPRGALIGLTLDAGALIALEKGSAAVKSVLQDADAQGYPIAIPAGALAQAWRDGKKQSILARFLKAGSGSGGAPTVEPLHQRAAKQAGELCALTGTSDVVDASVVLCAWLHRHAVVTSDPDDLRKLAPSLSLIVI
jgi:hypothetical protein